MSPLRQTVKCVLLAGMEISEVIQCREKTLQDLTEFTESCRKKLSEIFEALGWRQTLDTDAAEVADFSYL